MKILLVEDDLELATRLKQELCAAGFVVDHSTDGIDAEFMGNEIEYDLIVLDLGLPKKPGLEVLQSWRSAKNRTPVLILTARDSWHERVDGLKAGADDYLGKPFHFEELKARIEALIRRSHGQASTLIHLGNLQLDPERQVVIQSDKPISLTATEFRLLHYLMLNHGKILSKTKILEHLYPEDAELESNTIEVYIQRLRRKIGKETIETHRGQGYRLHV